MAMALHGKYHAYPPFCVRPCNTSHHILSLSPLSLSAAHSSVSPAAELLFSVDHSM